MTGEIEYDFYVEGEPPPEVEGAEIVKAEKIFGEWHKLTLRLPKERLREVADALRRLGLRLADSVNY